MHNKGMRGGVPAQSFVLCRMAGEKGRTKGGVNESISELYIFEKKPI